MNPRRRVLVLLAVLVALFAVWGWRQLPAAAPPAPERDLIVRLAEAEGEAPRARAPERSDRRTAPGAAVERVVDLEVAALEAHPGEYRPGRNPFTFYTPPPPPPPPPSGPTPEELEAMRRAREAAEAAAEAPPPGPSPPEITFAYYGSFGPERRRIAVLSDGENLYNVLLGDVVEGKFRVVDIGFESVALAYVDFPELPAARLPVGLEGF